MSMCQIVADDMRPYGYKSRTSTISAEENAVLILRGRDKHRTYQASHLYCCYQAAQESSHLGVFAG